MADQRRVFRVAAKIREIVALEMTRMSDVEIRMATVTSVSISKDLRHAKIYWNACGKEHSIEDTAKAFERAGGHLRKAVASELGGRFVPTLKFFYDDTLDEMATVDALLAKVAEKSGES